MKYSKVNGKELIQIAKESLALFVRSLPSRCKFSIYGFGERVVTYVLDKETNPDEPVIEYNNANKEIMLAQID